MHGHDHLTMHTTTCHPSTHIRIRTYAHTHAHMRARTRAHNHQHNRVASLTCPLDLMAHCFPTPANNYPAMHCSHAARRTPYAPRRTLYAPRRTHHAARTTPEARHCTHQAARRTHQAARRTHNAARHTRAPKHTLPTRRSTHRKPDHDSRPAARRRSAWLGREAFVASLGLRVIGIGLGSRVSCIGAGNVRVSGFGVWLGALTWLGREAFVLAARREVVVSCHHIVCVCLCVWRDRAR